jgi:hypothetical protein
VALNPIAFTERVVDDFLHYQLTTYPLADQDLYAQLRGLLRLEETRDTPLRQGPFVSLSRPFKQGASVARLVATASFIPAMQAVVPYGAHPRAGAPGGGDPRHHRATPRSSPPAPARARPRRSSTRSSAAAWSCRSAGAPPGMVAVLIYPMNALAEDQLDRLRGLLAGRGIPFGMYVGKTPEEEARSAASACRRAPPTRPTTSA